MTAFTPYDGVLGGVLIGLSAVLLMAAYGRIAGLSGIIGGLLTLQFGADFSWRLIFMVGLLSGAALAALLGLFDISAMSFSGGPLLTAAGGAVVGAGTAIGGGCTSGHGICGLSRLSARSIVSTMIFMATAIITVFVTRHLIGN